MKKFLNNYLITVILMFVLGLVLGLVLGFINEESFLTDSRVYLTEFACFYSTLNKKSTQKTPVVVEDLSIDKDKLLRDGYLLEAAAKETKEKDKDKEKVTKVTKVTKENLEKPLKIVINGLVFNKLNNEL